MSPQKKTRVGEVRQEQLEGGPVQGMVSVEGQEYLEVFVRVQCEISNRVATTQREALQPQGQTRFYANNCFINATIAALSATPFFYEFLKACFHEFKNLEGDESAKKKMPLTVALLELLCKFKSDQLVLSQDNELVFPSSHQIVPEWEHYTENKTDRGQSVEIRWWREAKAEGEIIGEWSDVQEGVVSNSFFLSEIEKVFHLKYHSERHLLLSTLFSF